MDNETSELIEIITSAIDEVRRICYAITIIFCGLRATDTITWGWKAVLSPVLAILAFDIIILIVWLILLIIIAIIRKCE